MFPTKSNKILSLSIRRSSKVKLTRTVSVSPCCSSSCHPAKCWTGADLREKAETDRKKKKERGLAIPPKYFLPAFQSSESSMFPNIRVLKSAEIIYLGRLSLKSSKQLKTLCSVTQLLDMRLLNILLRKFFLLKRGKK